MVLAPSSGNELLFTGLGTGNSFDSSLPFPLFLWALEERDRIVFKSAAILSKGSEWSCPFKHSGSVE